jgi:large conductance mechanosensitive channel
MSDMELHNMLKEFRDFISRGNVMDMAVGIIIGAAFTAIVASLVEDMLNPIIGLFTGGIDFSGLRYALTDGPDGAAFAYGNFIMAVINFLIVAFAVFMLVKMVNRIKEAGEKMAGVEQETAPEAPAQPTEIELLMEIRDALAARNTPSTGT